MAEYTYVRNWPYNPPHLKRCEKCFYWDKYTKTCDYILVEGHSRGCDAKDCDKFSPRFSARRKATEGNNEELSEQGRNGLDGGCV